MCNTCDQLSFECNVCGCRDHVVWTSAADQFDATRSSEHVYVQCKTCSLVSLTNPPSDEELAKCYPEESYWYEPDVETSLIMRLEQKYREAVFSPDVRQAKRFRQQGDMLDVGCGSGYVTSLYKAHGFSVTGIDLSEHAVRIAREHYGVDCICGSFSSSLFSGQSFDFVNMDYFLEHVRDPMQALSDAEQVLRPNGIIRLVVPNAESLQFSLFGGRWFNIEAPRHFHLFTPSVIERMLRTTGFTLIHTDHYSMKTNPVVCASSFCRDLNPHKLATHGFPAKLLFLALTWACFPFTLLEGLMGRGATMTVFAKKGQT